MWARGLPPPVLARCYKLKASVFRFKKCDPYLNVDAGLLNPKEHGECFVTKDGAETDLDLGALRALF